MAEILSGRCLLKQAELGLSASIKDGAFAKYAVLHRQGLHLRASLTWQTVCPATAFQCNLQQEVNYSCYVFEAATKQNSHYLPGCTWKEGESTRQ